MRGWIGDESAGVAVYSAFLAALAVGAGALAVDIGRLAVLRTQMQDAADAAALTGAVQLDGRDGARERARDAATNALGNRSALAASAPGLAVSEVTFLSALDPSPVAATGDADSAFIEVSLAVRPVGFLLAPVLDAVAGASARSSANVGGVATARPDPFICHAPPLMVCDFAEVAAELDLRRPENAGRQVRLKEPQSAGSPLAPGNFGLLALPDGSIGASDIEVALAAVEPADCYALDVTTAPGSKTNKVKDGVNARFDKPGNPWPYPAPNVINYPRDAELIADSTVNIGSGTWDLAGYWLAKHGGVPPIDLAGATRYQTYLYEQGLSYARSGRQTIYPIEGDLPSGYEVVTPPAASVPVAADPANADDPDYDGVPGRAVAANGARRRLVQVAQLECLAEAVHGRGTFPTDGNYLEMFITEEVRDPPEAAIYAEVVRPLAPANYAEFHANVRLVR